MIRCSFIPRVVAGDLLGGDVATVHSVVASIHEACADSEDLISTDPTFVDCDGEQCSSGQRVEEAMLVEEGTASHGVASEVVTDSNGLAHEDVSDTPIRQDGDAEGVVSNLKGSLLVLKVIKFIANACWS